MIGIAILAFGSSAILACPLRGGGTLGLPPQDPLGDIVPEPLLRFARSIEVYSAKSGVER